MSKTIEEINDKIKNHGATVVTADVMSRLVASRGPHKAAEEVDVVTTGTFGAMCSSGVWINFGHSDPPIKITQCRLNDVPSYSGVAAVDTYIGAAQPSDTQGLSYGGAHVIEDLVRRKRVRLHAEGQATDDYPRKTLDTELTIDDLNQAIMSNPRNAYQKYAAAANSGPHTLHTYMGCLEPGCGNVTFSGAGELSPLMNDQAFRTIGTGTRIILGGAPGYITGPGTQHDPEGGFATLMVQGDLKHMKARFLKAASFKQYGPTLYVGIAVPIPILNEEIAAGTGVRDQEIMTPILDFACSSRNRPVLGQISYAELKSGRINLNGRDIRTVCLSNPGRAMDLAVLLKTWIENGRFFITKPLEPLPSKASIRPLRESIPEVY